MTNSPVSDWQHFLSTDDSSTIEEIERGQIAKRRSSLGIPSGRPSIGLALSGGGIRSATFSLGVLKSLSRLKLVRTFDYLSTVSGGGYAGAFFCSLFSSSRRRGVEATDAPQLDTDFRESQDPLNTERGQKGIEHLRQSGRYLLPGRAGDAIQLATITLRNWAAVHAVIAVTLVALVLAVKLIQAELVGADWLIHLEVYLADHGYAHVLWPVQWLQGYPLGDRILLSPFWPMTALALCFWGAACCGFWLARVEAIPGPRAFRILGPAGVGAICVALYCGWLAQTDAFPRDGAARVIILLIAVLIGIGALLYGAAEIAEMAFDSTKREGLVKRLVSSFRGDTFFDSMPLRKWRMERGLVAGEEEDRVRSILNRWASRSLAIALVLAGLAIIDTVSASIYTSYRSIPSLTGKSLAGTGLGVGTVVQGLRWLLKKVQLSSFGPILRRFGRILALVVGIVLMLLIASLWATVANYLAWGGNPVGVTDGLVSGIPRANSGMMRLASLTMVFGLTAIAMGISFGFLNLSSFSAFYGARLRRAYLGASNIRRTLDLSKHGDADSDARIKPADQDDEADDLAIYDYYDVRNGETFRNELDEELLRGDDLYDVTGAPLHLINITINQTRGHGSQLIQRDRKGRPLTLSPAGFLFQADGFGGARKRIAFDASASLPLSTWVGISGAAFSTGLGQQTSLGLSLLAGIANLRLGFWWRREQRWRLMMLFRPLQWIQAYLMAEFWAAFRGIDDYRWYLTDGGHFENMAVYELVRRRVPLVVACDNGADPNYEFVDLSNLMRKIRIDFDVELEFLPSRYLNELFPEQSPKRRIFGELSELVRYTKEHKSDGPYAAVGRIRYPETPTAPASIGTFILIKPRLAGFELADLLDYNRANESFPQQSTGDQFFDEAQWESYYALGQRIIDLIFRPTSLPNMVPNGRRYWEPGSLLPIDQDIFPWMQDDWALDPREAESGAAG